LASRTYRPRTAHDETPLRRRVSGLGLALAVNFLLLLVLLSLGVIPLPQKPPSHATVVDLLPESTESAAATTKTAAARPRQPARPATVQPPKIPPIKSPIPAKQPLPMIEMSKDELPPPISAICPRRIRVPGARAIPKSSDEGRTASCCTRPNGRASRPTPNLAAIIRRVLPKVQA